MHAFRLPLDAEELYFLARGARSFGGLDIAARAAADLDADKDEVHVQVTATYHDAAAMHDATVCTLEQDGKHGLGIFVRPAPRPLPPQSTHLRCRHRTNSGRAGGSSSAGPCPSRSRTARTSARCSRTCPSSRTR
jgi:hypothetical protein